MRWLISLCAMSIIAFITPKAQADCLDVGRSLVGNPYGHAELQITQAQAAALQAISNEAVARRAELQRQLEQTRIDADLSRGRGASVERLGELERQSADLELQIEREWQLAATRVVELLNEWQRAQCDGVAVAAYYPGPRRVVVRPFPPRVVRRPAVRYVPAPHRPVVHRAPPRPERPAARTMERERQEQERQNVRAERRAQEAAERRANTPQGHRAPKPRQHGKHK